MPCGVTTTVKDSTKPVSDYRDKENRVGVDPFSMGLFVMRKIGNVVGNVGGQI